MTINVLFFGHYSDFFPGGHLAITVAENASVGDLVEALDRHDARLSNLGHCRFAVEEEYASLNQILKDGDTVAVLPPMSGG